LLSFSAPLQWPILHHKNERTVLTISSWVNLTCKNLGKSDHWVVVVTWAEMFNQLSYLQLDLGMYDLVSHHFCICRGYYTQDSEIYYYSLCACQPQHIPCLYIGCQHWYVITELYPCSCLHSHQDVIFHSVLCVQHLI